MLNCATQIAGSCHGGYPTGVFQYAQQSGLVLDTCQQYKAVDDDCTPLNTCRNCKPWGADNCFPVKNYEKYFVAEYDSISGEDAMMAEIYARGPIAYVHARAIARTCVHTHVLMRRGKNRNANDPAADPQAAAA